MTNSAKHICCLAVSPVYVGCSVSFNICSNCGEYRPDKAIVPEGAYAVCPICGFKHKIILLPLFILSGASGTGKSTISLALASKMKEVVVMESDILWRRELEQTGIDLREYRETYSQPTLSIFLMRIRNNHSDISSPHLRVASHASGLSMPNSSD